MQTLLALKTAPVLEHRGAEKPFAFFSDIANGVDSSMQFDMYSQAESVLAAIDSTVTTSIAPCSGTTATAQTTCANSWVSKFAPTAYRRPVDTTEVTNLMKVYAQGAMQDYKTGIKLVIEAIARFRPRSSTGPSSARPRPRTRAGSTPTPRSRLTRWPASWPSRCSARCRTPR